MIADIVSRLHEVDEKGIIAVIDQGVVSATNFLSTVIIARACTKEEFGLYALCFTIILFITDLQGALILSPYTVYFPQTKQDGQRSYTGSTLIHQLALSALAMGFLGIGTGMFSLGIGPKGLSSILGILVPLITFILLKEYCRKLSFAYLRITNALIIDLFSALTQICGLLFLALNGLLSTRGAYIVMGISCAIPSMIWLIMMRKRFKFQLYRVTEDLNLDWVFGRWLLAMGLVYMATNYVYPWLLSFFHGTIATAAFAAYAGIANLSAPMFQGVRNFLEPKAAYAFTHGRVRDLKEVLRQASYMLTLSMGLVCLILFIFGGRLVVLIYGDKYAGGGWVVFIISLSLFFSASGVAMGVAVGLWAIGKPIFNFVASLFSLAVTLILGVWAVKQFGPLGAGLSLLIGNSLASAARYFFFARATDQLLDNHEA